MSRKKPSSTSLKLDNCRTELEPRPLLGFFHGSTSDEVTFARFYWGPVPGDRESIEPKIRQKLHPAGDQSSAIRSRVLLPYDAPDLYVEQPLLLAKEYERNLPDDEVTAYAMMTMRFAQAVNSQGPFERVNCWVREQVVLRHQVAAIVVFHAPWIAAGGGPAHAHAIILGGLRLGRFGWAPGRRAFASDKAASDARKGWESHLAKAPL